MTRHTPHPSFTPPPPRALADGHRAASPVAAPTLPRRPEPKTVTGGRDDLGECVPHLPHIVPAPAFPKPPNPSPLLRCRIRQPAICERRASTTVWWSPPEPPFTGVTVLTRQLEGWPRIRWRADGSDPAGRSLRRRRPRESLLWACDRLWWGCPWWRRRHGGSNSWDGMWPQARLSLWWRPWLCLGRRWWHWCPCKRLRCPRLVVHSWWWTCDLATASSARRICDDDAAYDSMIAHSSMTAMSLWCRTHMPELRWSCCLCAQAFHLIDMVLQPQQAGPMMPLLAQPPLAMALLYSSFNIWTTLVRSNTPPPLYFTLAT